MLHEQTYFHEKYIQGVSIFRKFSGTTSIEFVNLGINYDHQKIWEAKWQN